MTRHYNNTEVQNYCYYVSVNDETVASYIIFHQAYLSAINLSNNNIDAKVRIYRYKTIYGGNKVKDKRFSYLFINGAYVAPRKEEK